MVNNGLDSQFQIHRKKNLYAIQFLMYWKGPDSASASWNDAETTNIDPTNSSALVAPYGYLPRNGSEYLSGNLGVSASTITEFTICAIIVRNEASNNEGIYYGLFGSTHYPRLYFVGDALHAEIKLDGNVKSITVSSASTYLKLGYPHMIVFRGSNTTGIELLIDGVSCGTQTDTGTAFSVGSGDFKLLKDMNLSYFQKGALRFLAACASKMTDAQITAWRTMLDYEGYFAKWRDNFAKWSGNNSFTGSENQIASSPYYATTTASSNVTAGFEEKDDRHTAFLNITSCTADADAYLSLAVGSGNKVISSAEAKLLPGVTAADSIRVSCELYAEGITATKKLTLEVDFYNESATQQGSTTSIPLSSDSKWQRVLQNITVPSNATRVNFTLHAECNSGETFQGWISSIRIIPN